MEAAVPLRGWNKRRCNSENYHRLMWQIVMVVILNWGTRWHSWLRHCATIRKVAGSIPVAIIGIFHWHNPSGRIMALGLTQPLTEMSTRNIPCGVKAAGA